MPFWDINDPRDPWAFRNTWTGQTKAGYDDLWIWITLSVGLLFLAMCLLMPLLFHQCCRGVCPEFLCIPFDRFLAVLHEMGREKDAGKLATVTFTNPAAISFTNPTFDCEAGECADTAKHRGGFDGRGGYRNSTLRRKDRSPSGRNPKAKLRRSVSCPPPRRPPQVPKIRLKRTHTMSLAQESPPYPAEEPASFPAEHETPSLSAQESTSLSAEHNSWHSAQSTPQITASPAPSYLPQEAVPFAAQHGVSFSTPDGSPYSTHSTASYPVQPFLPFSAYYNPTLPMQTSAPFAEQNSRATSSAIYVSAIGKAVEEQLEHADLLMSFNQNPLNGAKVKKTRRRRAPANTIEKKPRKPRAKRVSIFDNSFAGLDKSQRISASIEAVIQHAMTDAELKDRMESPRNNYDTGYDHQADTDSLKQVDGDTSGSFNMMMTHICNSYCENLELSGAQPSLQCEESLSNDESSGHTETGKETPSQSSSASPPKQTGGALQTLCDAARIFRGPDKPVKRTR
ncbi:hypothetical protein AAVH_33911, partial [Aphelenchoides avenae]